MNNFSRLRLTMPIALVALLSLTFFGCQNMSKTGQGAAVGAGAGAVVGGVIGKATGSTARGAIIGAAVGGTAGAVIGSQMDRQRAELARELEGATVERYGEGLLITFASGLLFGFDSDVVQGNARANLTNLAESLRQYPDTEVLIVGHTDNVGRADYNEGLSLRRANAARQFLISQGVQSNRIRTEGMGLREPVASNETEAGRAQNRRVEVAVFASEEHRQELIRRHGGE
jgi:outer membrane protein OmpA-like peptidoglycan-associated protein